MSLKIGWSLIVGVVIVRVFIAFVVLNCCSCVDSLDRFIQDPPAQSKAAIKQKIYNKPPLNQDKLATLLDMAAYTGPPDRYGVLTIHRSTNNKRMDPVAFSHWVHRTKYTCRVCHLELEFSFKNGESGITREDNLDGRFCGACHDGETSFSVRSACNLCHISESKQKIAYINPGYEDLADRMPSHKYGDRLDWGLALKNGVITPKHSLYEDSPLTSMALPPHLKKALRWYTNVPGIYVEFPHEEHVVWLDCANCHPDIFSTENMATVSFDKEKNLYGMFCGVCHMTVAFPMDGCSRCHPGLNDRH